MPAHGWRMERASIQPTWTGACDTCIPHVSSFGYEVGTNGGKVLAEVINTFELCSLDKITEALHATVVHYRPTM
jgi:hypothetical protein